MHRLFAVLLLTILGGWLLAGLSSLTGPSTATAAVATEDSVDSMKIEYNVTPDGVLEVTERIVYRFGTGSGRHGIYRDLVTREEWVDDTSKDQKYEISDVKVSSPSGDSAEFTEETISYNRARSQSLRLKIGSANKTIVTETATYEISYRVRGALRHFDDHSELFWDATGDDWTGQLNNVSVEVTVPGGVTRTDCFAGPHGAKTSCDSNNVSAGKGTFSQAKLPLRSQLTIVAGIKPGVVSNDTPIVVDPPSLLERSGLTVPMVAGSSVVALGVPLVGVTLARRRNTDERYAGLPPGSLPATGSTVPVAKDTLAEDQIPVAFAPPQIPVAEAGLLIDAVANTRETAATLIDLAVRGGSGSTTPAPSSLPC